LPPSLFAIVTLSLFGIEDQCALFASDADSEHSSDDSMDDVVYPTSTKLSTMLQKNDSLPEMLVTLLKE